MSEGSKGSPQFQDEVVLLSVLHKGNQRLLVVGGTKVCEEKVAGRFVLRVLLVTASTRPALSWICSGG